MSTLSPAIVFENIRFYATPADIEGSPFWVDLWASVNGYRIGLQIKPQTYKAASLSIYKLEGLKNSPEDISQICPKILS